MYIYIHIYIYIYIYVLRESAPPPVGTPALRPTGPAGLRGLHKTTTTTTTTTNNNTNTI